ncbi:MAG: hypothetical protein LBD84_01440 [Campylobacteraceae bacterium]|jgi:hypothetical protein|nr:hypothetical protein [Campylobacteraceae bacterium]
MKAIFTTNAQIPYCIISAQAGIHLLFLAYPLASLQGKSLATDMAISNTKIHTLKHFFPK